MATEILYVWGPGENRLALLRDDRLAELDVLRPDRRVGQVLLARVTENAPKLGGAFVDIGAEKAGFLPVKGLTNGAEVMVQVKADAQGTKGCVLTGEVSLAGRNLAYSPFRPGLNVSRKLSDEKRLRLYEWLAPLMDVEQEGVVLRTHAASAKEDELVAELESLRDQWQAIAELAENTHQHPTILWTPSPLSRMLADNPGVSSIRVNDHALVPEVKALFPGPILVEPDIEAELEESLQAALDPVIPLACGGRVIIEQTAALTAIDVDSGGASGIEANTQAVAVIARQLRLRNIAGQILVDFVSGGGKGALFKLISALKQAVSRDAVATHVIGTTSLGLVEMTRERKGPSLADLLTERSQSLTAETLALEALRRLLAEARHRPGQSWTITAHPEVILALTRRSDAVQQAEQRLHTPITLCRDDLRPRDQIDIAPTGTQA